MAHFIWYNVYDGNLSSEVIFSIHKGIYENQTYIPFCFRRKDEGY
jgi:hypothetical protein